MQNDIKTNESRNVIIRKISKLSVFMTKKGFDPYFTVLGAIVRFFISAIIGAIIGTSLIICFIFALSFFPLPIMFAFFYLDILRILIVALITLFLVWQVIKIRKHARQQHEHARKIYRANAIAFFFILFVSYFSLVIHNVLTIREGELTTYGPYGSCKQTTKELKGNHYTVQLCSRRIGKFFAMPGDGGSGNDEIRLNVFDKNNSLVALRYFFDGGHGREGIDYENGNINYTGASDDGYTYGTIVMPPSKLEWLKIRIFPRIPPIRMFPETDFYLQDFGS
jgi:hypothetical protein